MRPWLLLCAMAACAAIASAQAMPSDGDWPAYGGDAGGQRFSRSTQINAGNVAQLKPAWTFHTHTLSQHGGANTRSGFEATPVLWKETLFFDTAFDEVFAVDAVTGQQRWRFDPAVNRDAAIYIATSRGVTLWHDGSPHAQGLCEERVFVATLDARLIALDARSGKPCPDFGSAGTVDLKQGVAIADASGYSETSPPVVVGDLVILGSAIADNRAVDVASGAVRGFDARSGKQLWSWEPLPWRTDKSSRGSPRAGSANAWSVLAADPEHGLVFVPTGSASTDGYGGRRGGDDRDADSLVALDAATGRRVWAAQLVHHDLWDYDVPAQPMLFTLHNVPAVAVATKQGMVFVFNRLTGEPLYPIEERPVPASTVKGEQAFATQPFSSLPALLPMSLPSPDLSVLSASDRTYCEERLRRLDSRGPFTPPSYEGSLVSPGPLGGANWGSGAFNPETGMYYVHIDNVPWMVRVLDTTDRVTLRGRNYLHKHMPGIAGSEDQSGVRTPDSGEISPQEGTPYWLQRDAVTTPAGLPCSSPPWGAVVALNLYTGAKAWTTPLGTLIPGRNTGTFSMGGAAATRGGVVFIAASSDSMFRALDETTGAVLWETQLPAPGTATPMIYEIRGREYVVIAAGGEGMLHARQSDAVVAFALPVTAKAALKRLKTH